MDEKQTSQPPIPPPHALPDPKVFGDILALLVAAGCTQAKFGEIEFVLTPGVKK